MGRRIRLPAALVLICLLLLLPGLAMAKSYSVPHVSITAALRPDGSLFVTERRTFRFEGSFSHLWQVIELPDRSLLQGFSLRDEQGEYQPDTSSQPHTYTIGRDNSGWRADWYVQAADTELTFTLTYRIENAVRMHSDGAELYWNLIGSGWAVGTDLAEVAVLLPVAPIDAWVEGPSTYQQYDGKQISFAKRDLPKQEAMTIRVLLPREAVPQSTLPPDGETLRTIRASEGRLTDPVHLSIQAGWALLALALSAWFYGRSVRRSAFDKQPAEERYPLPPAAVSALMGENALAGFRATLLDLALRGVIDVDAVGNGDWRFTRYPAAMADHERKALALFFRASEESILLSDWKATRGQERDNYQRLQTWYGEVKELIPAAWRAPYRLWPYLVAAVGLVVTFVTYPGPGRWLAGLASALLALLGILQRRYTQDGYRQMAAWEADRRRLKRSYQIAELPVAVALGIKPARHADPTHELEFRDFDWMHDTFLYFNTAYAAPASSGGSDSGGGGGGDGGGGGGAE